jgi:hypothetical protein
LEYEENKKIMDGVAELLDRYYMDTWSTGMFNRKMYIEMTPERAIKHVGRFVDKLRSNDRQKGKPISWFSVIEKYRLGGLHCHMSMAGIYDNWSYEDIGVQWRLFNALKVDEVTNLLMDETSWVPGGYFKIEKFLYELGASHYCGKYIAKDMCAWDFDFNREHKWSRVLKNVEHDWTMSADKKARILRDYESLQKRLLK